MESDPGVFIVRKPVLDRSNKVYGYKLVHTSVDHPDDGGGAGDSALQLIHDSMLVFNLNALSGGKKVFFNVNQETLDTNCFELLPKECAVIDLHPSLNGGEANFAACRRLKHAGYEIAASLGAQGGGHSPLLDLADIVTLDVRGWPAHEIGRDAVLDLVGGRRLLTRSVDSSEDHQWALDLGSEYIEGEYYSQPTFVTGHSVAGFRPSYLRLLRAINQSEPDFASLAAIIAPEVTLTYRLLRLVNSAIYGVRTPINSVDRALVMLGERGIRQWAALITMSELSSSAPLELVATSAIRARFCQLIGETLNMGTRTDSLFLVGLFSLLDVISGQPLDVLLDDLGIDPNVRDALMGRANDLRPVYELVRAYEQGCWEGVTSLSRCLGLECNVPAHLYLQSVEWANFSLDLAV